MVESKERSTEVEFSEFADRYALFRASRGREGKRKLFLRGFEQPKSPESATSRLVDEGFKDIEIVGYGKVHIHIQDGFAVLGQIEGRESEVYLAREIIEDHTEYPVLVEE